MKNDYIRLNLGGLFRRIFPSLLLLFAALTTTLDGLYAQTANTHKHIGVVVDSEGAPIVGAMIFDEGSSRGTTTSYSGEYELMLPSKSATIKCSFIGYTTAAKISTADVVSNITMATDEINIDDVVVVGYGTVRKSDVTGSVSRITSEDFDTKQLLSLEDALQGQMAGVTVMTTDGEPGATMSINIRGVGSFNASNDPLYVVDGVTMEAGDVVISPSEIESIDVLKDASSTAIYGSQGANGVILITTKSADKGVTKINYSGSTSVQTPMRLYEMMNAQEFAKYTLFGQVLIGSTTSTYVDPDGYEFEYGNGQNNSTYDLCMAVLSGENTTDNSWQDILYNNSFIQNHKIGITSGNDKTNLSLMGTYFSQTGIVANSDYSRATVRANVEHKATKWLTAGVNVSAGVTDGNKIYDGYIRSLLKRNPITEYNDINADDDDLDEDNDDDFLYQSNTKNYYKSTNATVKSWVDVKLSTLLRLNVSGSYGYQMYKAESYSPSTVAKTTNGTATTTMTEKVNYLNDNLLYITPKRMGYHNLDAMVGLSFTGNNAYILKASNQDFEFEDLGVYNMDAGSVSTIATNTYTFALMASTFARLNYQYRDKYLFTATFRADGVSKFYEGNKWAYFPSGAFAWRASEEPFIKDLNTFSNLKFRASVGVSGNSNIGTYQTIALLSDTSYAMDGVNGSYSLQTVRPENTDLQWETSLQYDLGVDMGFLKNRLTATFDLYYKRTQDMLLNETVPTFTGYSNIWTNRGVLDNKGAELQINAVIFNTRKFKWNTSFNIYANRSNVVYVAESGEYNFGSWVNGTNNYFLWQEGKPLGQFYGYNYLGVYKNQQEINDLGMTSLEGATIRPGYPKYEDLNGDGVIDSSDKKVIGCAEAKFQGGLTNNLTFKNFHLNLVFDFRYGGDVFNSTRAALENDEYWYTNKTKNVAEQGYYPTLYLKDTGEIYSVGNESTAYLHVPYTYMDNSTTYCSTLYVEDGSYLRLNSATLSYTLPTRISNKFYVSRFNIYVNVKNAFILTGYSGYSPIVNSGSSVLQPNVDNAAYPMTRNFTVGVNLTL